MSFLAVVVALALVAAGCGSTTDQSTVSSAPGSSNNTNLEVTLDADGPGGKPPQRAVIKCTPTEQGAACDLLAKLPDDFGAPTPPKTACTELYGGPDVVELHGSTGLMPLDTKLTRANGCEIARFDPFVPILQKLFPGYQPGGAIGA